MFSVIHIISMVLKEPTNFDITLTSDKKEKPEDNSLEFGKIFTDHMYTQEFDNGSWNRGKISPFDTISLSPSALVFHYGQEIFEGLKAFRKIDGEVVVFRPDQNAERFTQSAKRMMMPILPKFNFVAAIEKLVEIDQAWTPKTLGTSLYIRPTMIASEEALGVRASEKYLFFIILSPSGPYFKNGFAPSKIMVEDTYVRAVEGGTGNVKAGGNYAGSLLAAHNAKSKGYSQVLWLDAKANKYIEEVGAMNIAFVIDDEIYSPHPRSTILDGITRKSVKVLAQDLGIPFNEDRLTINEVIESIHSGNLTEIFGIGTAASISPIGEIKYKDENLLINNFEVGPISQKIYDELTGIQYGRIEDRHGWLYPIASK